MTNKILITGATGFIGSNLVKRFLSHNKEIIAIDNNFRGVPSRLDKFKDDIEYYDLDVRDKENFKKIAKNCKTIFHLAYINGTDNFYSKPDEVLDVAIKGIVNIFDICKETDVSELFIASSSEVFHKPDIIPTNENAPLVIPDINNPRYSYAGGKILYELMGKFMGKEYLEKLIVFRPFNVYGADMGMGHVIPQIIDRIKKINLNKNIVDFEIQGDGSQTRAFEYIDDFIDGLELIYQKGKNREVYNIGNDEEVTIKELVIKIFKLIDRNININILTSEMPSGGTDRRCPDITKLKSLGYTPKVNLNTGLERILKEKF